MSSINFDRLERVDVHSHAITPKYREFLIQTGHQNPDGMPAIPVRRVWKPLYLLCGWQFLGMDTRTTYLLDDRN